MAGQQRKVPQLFSFLAFLLCTPTTSPPPHLKINESTPTRQETEAQVRLVVGSSEERWMRRKERGTDLSQKRHAHGDVERGGESASWEPPRRCHGTGPWVEEGRALENPRKVAHTQRRGQLESERRRAGWIGAAIRTAGRGNPGPEMRWICSVHERESQRWGQRRTGNLRAADTCSGAAVRGCSVSESPTHRSTLKNLFLREKSILLSCGCVRDFHSWTFRGESPFGGTWVGNGIACNIQ